MRLKELAPVVAFAAGFVGRADEALKHVYFINGKACATSGNDGATWDAPAELDGVAAPAEQLSKMLSSLSSEHDEVTVAKTERRVVVKAGKFRAQLPLLGAEAWPTDLLNGWGEPEVTVALGDGFWAALEAVSFTIGPPGNPVQGGVFWGGETLVTYDGQRITAAPCGAACPVPEGALIPARFIKLTKYGFTGAAVDEAGRLWFVADGGAAWTVLMAVQFPAAACLELIAAGRVSTGMRTREDGTIIVMPDGVVSVLDRLLMSSKFDNVLVEAGAGSVRLSAPEEDGSGSAEETVAAEVDGPACSVTVSGRSLKEALTRVSKTMAVNGKVRPVYFQGDLSEHVFAPVISNR